MTKIIPKLWMGRLCLISVILLCSLFMSENAFSLYWHKRFAKVSYKQSANYNFININFLFHQYCNPDDLGYLSSCDFSYSEDGKIFNKLISVSTKYQNNNDRVSIFIHQKKTGELIKLYTNSDDSYGEIMPDGKDFHFYVWATTNTCHIGESYKGAYLCINWNLSKTGTLVNFIKIDGKWSCGDKIKCDRIKVIYPRNDVKSNSNRLENDSSVLKSEISNNVKAGVETDAIKVTGVKYGEKIKIYTATGVEVKSIVATDDAIKIQLPMNQIYIFKAGQTRYKAAL